ncbi:MAG: DoxX family protein [Vicinamibacterales bacterium]|nr:DoxX family membrane protein [Acidobacteriota bacterium]
MNGSSRGAALRLLGLMLGVFLIFEGLGKVPWLFDSAILGARLQEWHGTASPFSRWYLETVAMPGVPVFARMVTLGELLAGAALLFGFWTRLSAGLAALMVLNFHVASGILFTYGYLTNGYGLPVMGGLLALAIGGSRLPLSLSD